MASYSTKQRESLIGYLSDHTDENLSAGQIYYGLQDKGISLSAVYRNLQRLEDSGDVIRISVAGSREIRYQYVAAEKCRQRLHLVCRRCGRAEHVLSSDEDDFILSLSLHNMFSVDVSSTVIYGMCHACQTRAAAGTEDVPYEE